MTWFAAKEWKNRLVEFAGRRSLKNVSTNETTVYDVTRNEGQVSQEGDSFSATTMNDLEQRISDAFAEAEEANTQLISDLKFPDGTGFYPDIKDGQQGYNTDPARGADTFHPFKNVEYLGEKQGSVSDRRYATFNISDYANYQGITVDNIFPTISYMKHYSNGDGAGTMSWSYNPEAGMLTFDNGDNSLVSIRAKIYVI